MYLRPDLVEPQDGLNALVQEVSLLEQTAAVKSHQLFVEVYGEDIVVESTLHAFSFPQGHWAQRASFEMGRTCVMMWVASIKRSNKQLQRMQQVSSEFFQKHHDYIIAITDSTHLPCL